VNIAFAPIVRRCQAEDASCTAKEGFLRDRQEIPARFPHRPPTKAVQRIPQQRRAMMPPDQRHLIALNVHEPVLVHRCGDRDYGRRLPHRVVEMDPVDEVAGAVRAAPIICAGKIPDISRQWRLQNVEASRRRRSCPHRMVPGRFVIRATRERGVGVPSSRSLATTTREALLILRTSASAMALRALLVELPGIEPAALPGNMPSERQFRPVSFRFIPARYLRFRFWVLKASRGRLRPRPSWASHQAARLLPADRSAQLSRSASCLRNTLINGDFGCQSGRLTVSPSRT
jgi:hypothetical protein